MRNRFSATFFLQVYVNFFIVNLLRFLVKYLLILTNLSASVRGPIMRTSFKGF